jgi:FAD/FMN-containing dehydrogenase
VSGMLGVVTPPAADRTDRRQFLHQAAAAVATTASAAVFGTLAACAGPQKAGPPSTTPTSAPATTTTEAVNPAAWSGLSQSLDGTLVLPAASAYSTAKLVYNLRFATADPAAVAYCATATDVQRCVNFARDHGLTPTARSGGHSYGGYSTGTGLVIDVSRLNTVDGDSDTMTAVIGTGSQLVDVYDQLSNVGMLLPGGSCPSVGIAGLTLGGGIGVVGRKYGLTCDNLVSVDTVTADGRLLTCSADRNADLYWASRGGGGGNFGIATSFTFGTHPLPPLALFTINWPWAAAADVLGSWQAWTATAPEELWSNCQLQSAGSDGLNVRCNGVFVGSATDLNAALQPLVAGAGTPSNQFVGPENYLHAMLVEAGCQDLSVAQCHLSGAGTQGTLARSSFAATSSYLSQAFSPAGVAAALAAIEQLHATVPQLGGGLVFDAYGGVINAIAPDATAFVHRRQLCAVQSSVSWSSGDSSSTVDGAQAWLAHSATALAPFVSSAAYQNYIDPLLVDWADAYYGANLPRLVSVKRRYDPDDVFHFAQSIPTQLPA